MRSDDISAIASNSAHGDSHPNRGTILVGFVAKSYFDSLRYAPLKTYPN